MKGFSHARGCDQVLKLQCDLGALLRQTAVFERIRELVRFADPEQKLRLRHQLVGMYAILPGDCRKSGEVYVSGNVLFPGSFVGIRARRVLAVGHDGAQVPARELLLARVAVVDDDEESCLHHLRIVRDLLLG